MNKTHRPAPDSNQERSLRRSLTKGVSQQDDATPRPQLRQRSRQTMSSLDQLEGLWNDLLSRQPELIQAAFDSLDEPAQKTVLSHLERMVSDPGWQLEQVASAKAAIHLLENRSDQG